MRPENDKHKKIVRNRAIARTLFAFFILAILALAGIGIIKAAESFRQFRAEREPEPAASEETAETTEETSEVVSIADAGLEDQPEEEQEKTETEAAENLEEQYDSVLEMGVSGAGALEIEEMVNSMSLEEKVAQLFFVRPEQLTKVATVTQAGDATKAALEKYPVGGIIYFSKNLTDPEQTKTLINNTHEFVKESGGVPLFIGIDEEGGSVARLAENPEFGIENAAAAEETGKSGDGDKAYAAGSHIGEYLGEYGFNLDFAPVADVREESDSAIGDRSFGSDPENVSLMADRFADGLKDKGIIPVYKHFPGFGRAKDSTDLKEVKIEVGIDELKSTDLLPYTVEKMSADRMIMTGNMAFPTITGNDMPACMSELIIRDYLRGELKFNGVVITDSLEAKAISGKYQSSTAAVNCLKAGADMLLIPADFESAYNGILSKVRSGELSEDIIDGAVSRILTLKSRTIGLQ